MKICAIDSSGLVASVCITEDDRMIAEYTIQYKVTHSQTLLPMLDDIKGRIELDLQGLDAYAVAAGPGSFTGLRIGMATVKGLGFVIDRPVVAVPTLEALAYNIYGTDALICPIMDARRHQVYTGVYENVYSPYDRAYRLKIVNPGMAVGFDELCSLLNEKGRKVIFTGDGIPVYGPEMDSLLKVDYSFAPSHMNRQRAGALAALAYEYMNGRCEDLEGHISTPDEVVPVYLRMSQAEREKKEREGAV